VSAPLVGFHARARIGSRNSAACPSQKATRSSNPRRPAISESLWQAARHSAAGLTVNFLSGACSL
jgi:hypothetical protein